MQLQTKPSSTVAGRESSYSSERKTQALILETADALRAEQRRASYATIDSNASKWRYSVVRAKG